MGIFLIILGLLCFGLLAEVLWENESQASVTEPLTLVGQTVHVSDVVLLAVAFTLGVVSILLILAGFKATRRNRRRRRSLKDRVQILEAENARLVARANLEQMMGQKEAVAAQEEVVVVPEAEESPAEHASGWS
jgi:hypothetical protein